MNKLLTLLLMAASINLTACNTIKGAGEDIQAGGKAISRSASEVKAKL